MQKVKCKRTKSMLITKRILGIWNDSNMALRVHTKYNVYRGKNQYFSISNTYRKTKKKRIKFAPLYPLFNDIFHECS